MTSFWNYFKYVVLALCITSACTVSAGQTTDWVDIHLVDTGQYTDFSVNHVYNHKYPPANAFDANLKTCWVSGSNTDKPLPFLYIKLPSVDGMAVNIFSGYGKSKKLYAENARPKKLRFTLYTAFNPEGYVSETGVLYKAVKFPDEQIVHLDDRFAVQSVMLDFAKNAVADFETKLRQQYNAEYKMPIAESSFILKMEILDTFPGTKYNDVCISEIYFNDCLMSFSPADSNPIQKVYLNQDENVLLLDDGINHGVVAYSDPSSVLQLIEISKNKQWAILISMPAEIQGRAETTWLLVDLQKKTIASAQLEKITGNTIGASLMYFETSADDRFYLIYSGADGQDHKIELR